MNTTKHVVLLTSNIFGRGFDSRRLHHTSCKLLVNVERSVFDEAPSPALLLQNKQVTPEMHFLSY